MLQRLRETFDAQHLIVITKGLAIGLLTGITVGAFRYLIEASLKLWQYFFLVSRKQPVILIGLLLIGIIIGLFVGYLTKQQPHISGSGIPEVEAQLQGRLQLNWWKILWRKFVGGVLAIGSGLFLGREGPSIQLGSSIGQGFAQYTKTTGTKQRVMIATGAASGLAAAFDAPIAGTMFVLEEVYHNFSPLVWMSALAGAIGADFVTSNIFGLTPVLHLVYQHSFPLTMYWHLLLLGMLLGLLGLLYQKVLLYMPKLYAKLGRIPRYLDGVIAFILLIPVGYFWPNSLGGGNSLILSLQQMKPGLLFLLLIFAIRFIFSMVSYGSGLPGGIFLPILTLGALIGAVYGQMMVSLGWMPQSLVVNCIIMSMAGYFAGIGKAPFTAILLITEMVGNLRNLLPLAVVSLVAYLIVDMLGGQPIYESLSERMTFHKTLAKMTGKVDQVEIPVYEGSSLATTEVRDVKWPQGTLLIDIRRGERRVIPHGDSVIRAGDTLVLLTEQTQRDHIFDYMAKLQEV